MATAKAKKAIIFAAIRTNSKESIVPSSVDILSLALAYKQEFKEKLDEEKQVITSDDTTKFVFGKLNKLEEKAIKDCQTWQGNFELRMEKFHLSLLIAQMRYLALFPERSEVALDNLKQFFKDFNLLFQSESSDTSPAARKAWNKKKCSIAKQLRQLDADIEATKSRLKKVESADKQKELYDKLSEQVKARAKIDPSLQSTTEGITEELSPWAEMSRKK